MTECSQALRETLERHQQGHVLAGWEMLGAAERATLIEQLQRIDFPQLTDLHRQRNQPASALALEAIEPIPVEPADLTSASAIVQGEEALRRGEVAALVVAGGQGSRLGFEKPKGMYPVGPVSRASLFQIHAEKVLALGRRFGTPVPLLVMTSPATDAETRAFFAANDNFSLAPENLHFFRQGTMPALDIETGRLLLEKPGSLFLSPNGHGGTLTALTETGLLKRLQTQGVRHIFYFQVDNPLVKIADPEFVGRHLETAAEISAKVVFKERPEEKVGVLALIHGKCGIVEYSDLPAAMAAEREATGELRFRAGNPAIHLFSVDFLDRLTAAGNDREALPFHTARKKVPHFDPVSRAFVTPRAENALKFERFIFDALPLAERWLVKQTRREEEFAPLKNADGSDSPYTVNELLVEQAARWFEAAGVAVPRDDTGQSRYPLEVAPQFALDAAELAGKLPAGFRIQGPTYLR